MISDLRTIGETCAKYRRFNNISQDYVSAKSGYARATIVKFEKGESNNLFLFLTYLDMFNIPSEVFIHE